MNSRYGNVIRTISTASAYFMGSDRESGGEDRDEDWRCENAADGDGGERAEQRPRDVRSEIAHVADPAPGPVLAQDGDECLGEGAFGEQPAQEVRDAERDEEGIRAGACAERLGDDHVAHESEHARGHRARADHSRRFDKRPAHRSDAGGGALSGSRASGIMRTLPARGRGQQESRTSGKLPSSKEARAAGDSQARA